MQAINNLRSSRIGLGSITAAASVWLTGTAVAQFQLPDLEVDFNPAVMFPVLDSMPRGLDSGDLNADGNPDVAVVSGDPLFLGNGISGAVTVFLNSGDWSNPAQGFDTPLKLDFSDLPGTPLGQELVIARIDGDIHPDIAVTVHNKNESSPYGWVIVYLNRLNDGSPTTDFDRTVYPVINKRKLHGIVARDFTSDGFNDLAIAGSDKTDPANITALLLTMENDGSGTFGTMAEIPLPGVTGSAWDVAAGRFDLDQTKPDLATANNSHNSITQLKSDGSGGFTATTFPGPSSPPFFDYIDIAAGKLNGDAYLDLALPEFDCGVGSRGGVGVHRVDPITGDFVHERPNGEDSGDHYDTGAVASVAVAIANVNGGTNKRDVIVALSGDDGGHFDRIDVIIGNGDGTLVRGANGSAELHEFDPSPESNDILDIDSVITVDLNQDGLRDIITSNTATDSISVLINSSHPPAA